MGVIKGLLLALVIVVVGSGIVIYGGLADVSALRPHAALTTWALSTAMEQSVKRHAREIVVPATLPPASAGFRDYDAMCVICHGAPGSAPSELAQGLRPDAPSLAKVSPEWSDAELYWIIKNGVKMTGMPAWGVTHSEQELWGVVAFVRALPTMTPREYAAMKQQMGAEPEGAHGH